MLKFKIINKSVKSMKGKDLDQKKSIIKLNVSDSIQSINLLIKKKPAIRIKEKKKIFWLIKKK